MSTIPRSLLKFRPTAQGRAAQLPNGGTVYEWDQKHFAVDATASRFARVDPDATTTPRPALGDVVPELADDSAVEALRKAGRAWTKARDAERKCAEACHAAIVAAVAAGISERRAATIAGIDRMTVRRALGKL